MFAQNDKRCLKEKCALSSKINYTDVFIKSLSDIEYQKLTQETFHQARLCLLDYFGVTFAGASLLGKKGLTLANSLGRSSGNALVVGYSYWTNVLNAAFMNGYLAHVAELDDGERVGMAHSGAVVISALIAIAKIEKLKFNDLLFGIVIGYEASIRLSRTMQPALKSKGFHATGICGTIGAAMGISAALRLARDQMKSCLSAASTSASGLLESITGGSQQKPLNAGHASMSGLLAALTGKNGFIGPDDILGGEKGLLHNLTDKFTVSNLERQADDKLLIHSIYRKPYAACRHCHAAIEASIKLMEQSDMDIDNIDRVIVSTYDIAVRGHDHKVIQGSGSAKMSIPYSVAVAIVARKAGLSEFEAPFINNPVVNKIMHKVDVVENEELTSLVPQKRSAIVEFDYRDGLSHSLKVDHPKGEPENPLTTDDLISKFSELAKYSGKSCSEIKALTCCVLEEEADLGKLLGML